MQAGPGVAYDCGQSTIIARLQYGAITAKFHCRKAACEECAPIRRAQLRARGRQGEPNRFITLTSWVRPDQTPEEAYADLLDATQKTIRAARHEEEKPPERRWSIPGGYKNEKRRRQVERYAREDDAAGLTSIEIFRTVERTKRGWPHFHMVARCPYIPQEWLSWQMAKRIKSPVVDIRAIRNLQRQVAYMVAYVTKEEHRFGNSRRYSFTQKYKLPSDTEHVPLAPPGTRFINEDKPLHTFLNAWIEAGHKMWKAGPRWHGYGEWVNPDTGEICPHPPDATPWEPGDAWEA